MGEILKVFISDLGVVRTAARGVLAALLLAMLGIAATASAHTSGKAEVQCPVCQRKFAAVLDFSGTMTGRRLDGKPMGPAPAPWLYAVCPRCRYVFAPEEEPPDQPTRVKVRAFLKSPAYRRIASSESSHYRKASILEYLGESPVRIGWAYLEASWQVEGTKAYPRYLQAAWEQFEKAFRRRRALTKAESDQWHFAAPLVVELARLQKRFRTADARLQEISRLRASAEAAGVTVWDAASLAVFDYERELIRKHDSRPRELPAATRALLAASTPAKVEARKLFQQMAGYAEASHEWRIIDTHLGAINWFPYVLFGQLEGPDSLLVNRAWWFIDVDKSGAMHDWSTFLAARQRVEEAVALHPWLMEWRRAGQDRKIEAQIYNDVTWTRGPEAAWEMAGFKGKATIELQLRGGSGARVFLGPDDGRALVTSANGEPSGAHWLDKLRVFFFHGEKPDEFLVVERDGTWKGNVPKPQPAEPAASGVEKQ